MPPKKNVQRHDRTPEKAKPVVVDHHTTERTAPQVDDGEGQPRRAAAAAAAAPERPRASFISAYFFAASFLVRSILVPLYGSLWVSGIISRWSYPSEYTAPGVSCAIEALDGPRFCEDQVLLETHGLALLSCDAGRGEWNTVMGPLLDPTPRGQLWVYDYADTKTSVKADLTGFPAHHDFHPLGITTFSDALKTSLFVINHQRTGPSIEIFTVDVSNTNTLALQYEQTIRADPLIKSANGIVAMNHTHLYVTNDHAWTRLEAGTPWAILETFGGSLYGQSWITHIDLSPSASSPAPRLRKVYRGLAFANGLAKGSDETLYAASSVAGTVTVLRYENATSPVLGYAGEIDFGYSIDNVHVVPRRPADAILVAGHPSFPALTKLARDPHNDKTIAPSWISLATRKSVDEILAKKKQKPSKNKDQTWHDPKWNEDWHVQTIFEDEGQRFSSSTGAALDLARDIMITTGLYETGLLVCRGTSGKL